MANLEKNIEEKLTEVFKGEFEKEDFELNYDSIEKISSIIDGRFEGSNIVNQEYRYAFNLDPCAD